MKDKDLFKGLSSNYRRDFLSVDKEMAISAEGEIFKRGDKVKHESQGSEWATIYDFELDEKSMDVIANTSRGSARICFIYKDEEE